jgi:hypothetical protein
MLLLLLLRLLRLLCLLQRLLLALIVLFLLACCQLLRGTACFDRRHRGRGHDERWIVCGRQRARRVLQAGRGVRVGACRI